MRTWCVTMIEISSGFREANKIEDEPAATGASAWQPQSIFCSGLKRSDNLLELSAKLRFTAFPANKTSTFLFLIRQALNKHQYPQKLFSFELRIFLNPQVVRQTTFFQQLWKKG